MSGSLGVLRGLLAALLPAGAGRLLALTGVAARQTGARPYLVGGRSAIIRPLMKPVQSGPDLCGQRLRRA